MSTLSYNDFKPVYYDENTLLGKFYKSFTLFVLFIIPVKVARVYAILSIISAIYKIRNKEFSLRTISVEYMEQFLNTLVKREALYLPMSTTNWYWQESFFDKTYIVNNENITLRDMILDNSIFYNHIREIVGMFLAELPVSLKFKLRLPNEHFYLKTKHSVMSAIVHHR